MSTAIIKIHIRRLTGLGQYGLTIGEPGECGGVETGEGMKRIAFYLISVHCRVNKAKIKMSIVGYHH